MEVTQTTSGDRPSRALRRLLLSPFIWAVYHLVGYLVVETACTWNLLDGNILGINALVFVVILLTLLALLPTLYIAWVSYRRAGSLVIKREGENVSQVLEIVSVLFSVILALIILADGISLLVLGPCGGYSGGIA